MSNMVVNTNVMALNSHRALKNVGNMQSQASARLSTGSKINTAADDAAGLAISEKMRSQIRGLDMASKNAQDGISLVQTAEGGMQEIGNMVQRVRELTVQAANGTNEAGDTAKIQGEVSQLVAEIDSMSGRVEFNKKNLLNSGAGGLDVDLQVGANDGQQLKVNIASMSASDLGLKGFDARTGSLSTVDDALEKVSNARSSLGAVQNRLEYTIKSLDISSENLSASESRIRDTDMAKEMMKLTKANVLQQASTNMLSQANQAPQNVLQLLR